MILNETVEEGEVAPHEQRIVERVQQRIVEEQRQDKDVFNASD